MIRLPNTPTERPRVSQKPIGGAFQDKLRQLPQSGGTLSGMETRPFDADLFSPMRQEQTESIQEPHEDQRQLAHWREQLYRMFALVGAVTDTPGLIGAGAVGTLTVTVQGCFADQNETVEIGAPSTIDAGLTWCGFVSANNTVTIRIHNGTGGGITPASLTWCARVTP